MRISYCNWGMMKMGPEEGLPAIAKIGYTGVEIAVTPKWPCDVETLDAARRKQIKQLCKDNGLVISAVAGHTSFSEDDPDKHAANMKRIKASIDLAAEWRSDGEPAIMASLMGGHEDDWGRQKNLIAERVYAIGEYAKSKDVIFAVEPHSGTTLDLPRKVVWLMEQVKHPNVKCNFDISHFEIRAIPFEDCVPQLVPYSVHTHVKDQRGIYPYHEFLTPGSGPFRFDLYLKAMHAAGYTGWIGMEVSVMVQRKPGYDPVVDAALGYFALVRAFNETGVPLQTRG